MRQFVSLGSNESTRVVHVARAEGRPLPGKTPEEQLERYKTAGELMGDSRFCLIPAGDNEVSSRLYSAMSAGCVPIVIANQLSGAFASHVPYARFWVRVEQQTFMANPLKLLGKLRAITSAELAERRALMLRYVPDITYAQQPDPHIARHAASAEAWNGGSASSASRGGGASSGGDGGGGTGRDEGGRRHGLLSSRLSVPSRLASNLLRAAHDGCMLGAATPLTGIYPQSHKYAQDDKW